MGKSSSDERMVCITSDAHIGTFAQDFEDYLDPEFRDAYRGQRAMLQSVLGPDGEPDIEKLLTATGAADADVFSIFGEILHPDVVARQQEERRQFLVDHFGDADGLARMSTGGEANPLRQIKELEADGTVGGIALPQAGAWLGPTTPEQAKAGADAVNRWVVDYTSEQPERHAGAFVVSLDAGMDVAVGQVKWAREHGLRGGLLLDTNPELKGLPLYNARWWDPLWEVCADLGVVVNIHAAGGQPPPKAGGEVLWILDLRWFLSRPLRYFIVGGVFERHPKLKVMFIECNAAWAIEELEKLDLICTGQYDKLRSLGKDFFHIKHTHDEADEDWKMAMLRRSESVLKKTPTEYFQSNVWLSISASPEEWEARNILGADKLLWGSDYPHNESTWPRSMENVKKTVNGLEVPVEDTRKMMGTNAAELWEFDLDALRPIAATAGPAFYS